MALKNIALLLVVSLIIVTVISSCNSPEPTSNIPEPVSPAPQEDAGPQFTISQNGTQAFKPITITPTTVTVANISAARDLTGMWRGSGVSYWLDGASGERVARTTWEVSFNITYHQGNTVRGTLTMINIEQENLTPQDIPRLSYGPDDITNGSVSSTTLDFSVDVWHWTFTFTTDLMSGQYTAPGPGIPCDLKAFTLTRQS